MNGFRLALIFLTLLPFSPKKKIPNKAWGACIKYFSSIGLIFGLVNVLLFYFFDAIANGLWHEVNWLFAVAILSAHVILSGGLHLDGLMDVFDGIASSKKTKAEVIAVMRDSHIGAFAAMSCLLVFIAKVIALAKIDYEIIVPALLLVPMLSRAMVVAAMSFQQKLGDKNRTSSLFEKSINIPMDFIFNLVPIIVIGSWLYANNHEYAYSLSGEIAGVFDVLLLVAVIIYMVQIWLSKKLYGHTGDSYGASVEIFEASAYFLLALLL